MKTRIDNDLYDSYARSFLATLTKYLENDLAEVKLSKNEKKELTQTIVFNVATLLDGTGSLEHKKKQLVPHLSFQLEGAEEAIIDDGTIALHELCELD